MSVEGDLLGTLGIFLSGAGSLLNALGAIHFERKRAQKDCEQRIDAFKQGLRLGGRVRK